MTAQTVVGTPVEMASDDDRSCTILLSDLHIPEGGGPAKDLFCSLLDSIRDPEHTRVVVLGDLFDAYIGPKQNLVGVSAQIVEAVRATADRGVSVTVLHGNRDFMLDQDFATRAACRVVAGGLRIQLGGQPCLLLHGDELCQRDLPYQRAKRILRHSWARAVFRNLPLAVAMRLAERARNRSATVIASGDQSRFDPTAAALEQVFDGSVATLVFGHIHRPARGRFGAGEYAILPAFDEAGIYLEYRDGGLGYCRAGGVGVEDYPARDFR